MIYQCVDVGLGGICVWTRLAEETVGIHAFPLHGRNCRNLSTAWEELLACWSLVYAMCVCQHCGPTTKLRKNLKEAKERQARMEMEKGENKIYFFIYLVSICLPKLELLLSCQQVMVSKSIFWLWLPCRYLPPDTVNSFYAVWNTHGAVNKHVVIYGHTHVSFLSILTSPVSRHDH